MWEGCVNEMPQPQDRLGLNKRNYRLQLARLGKGQVLRPPSDKG
jgi:hypothetical protein